MDTKTFRAWICEAARLVVGNADHLTRLDAAIGDTDHGINLRRGFRAAVAMRRRRCPPADVAAAARGGSTRGQRLLCPD
jgi:dihydroxyacetone kinase-like protein